jgi:hypothetical protein
MAWDDDIDYTATGGDLYSEGKMAWIKDEPFDEMKPTPWRLGWVDMKEIHEESESNI